MQTEKAKHAAEAQQKHPYSRGWRVGISVLLTLLAAGLVWFLGEHPNDSTSPLSDQGAPAFLRDVKHGQRISLPVDYQGSVIAAHISENGLRFLTASDDHVLFVWDALSGQQLSLPIKLPTAHDQPITSAQFSADGLRFVATAKLYSGAMVSGIPGEEDQFVAIGEYPSPTLAADFSRDGKRIATASFDHSVRVWDAYTGEPLIPPIPHKRPVTMVSFSPDGNSIVTAGLETAMRVWNAQTGEPSSAAIPIRDFPVSLKFSPNSQHILVTIEGYTQLWDAATGQEVTAPMLHKGAIHLASFSPNGRLIVTVDAAADLSLWDAQAGFLHSRWTLQEKPIYAQFSVDSQRVITVSNDGIARAWMLD